MPTTFPEPQLVIDQLMAAKEVGEFVDERMTAAEFVYAYGPLADLFQGKALTDAQWWEGPEDSAFGMLGHWSAERGDHGDHPPLSYAGSHLDDCPICVFLEAALGVRYTFVSPQHSQTPLPGFGHRRGVNFCRTCRGGLANHRLAVEEATDLPHAVCVGRWKRFEPLAGRGGDAAEYQISDAWNAKWAAPLADGSWAVIYRTYYLADYDGRVFVERQDEYLTCADPNHPGGTEHGPGDLRYAEVDSDDPKREDIHALATESFDPYPGEWQTYVPHTEAFANAEEED